MSSMPVLQGPRLQWYVIALLSLLWLSTAPSSAGRVNQPFVADLSPVASLIAIGTPTADHTVTVTGMAGSVSPNAQLILLNLDTGHFVGATASATGSFTAAIFGARGTSIMIKVDPEGVILPGYLAGGGPAEEPGNQLQPMPGTILRVPDSQPADSLAFAGAGPLRIGSLPVWTFVGRTSGRQFAPGDELTVTGVFTVESASAIPSGKLQIGLMLERLSTETGDPVLANSSYASSSLTPTGLPIERTVDWFSGLLAQRAHSLIAAGGNRVRTDVQVTLLLPEDLPPGYYVPCVIFYTEASPQPSLQVARTIDGAVRRPLDSSVYGPVARVGAPSPPRLALTLLNDDLHNGTRGVGAREDRGKLVLSTRMRFQSNFIVIPRVSPATGEPLRYRLEPFAPTVSIGDRGIAPNSPMIPFRFPSGELLVRIESPQGSQLTIGPAPFAQARIRGAGNQFGTPYEFGGHPTDFYQLSTMRPEFEVSFASEGLHRITVEGTIKDVWGTTWSGKGTYEVYVGRALALGPSVLPGSPLVVGDTLSLAGVVAPPIPADVEVTFSHSTGVPGAPLSVHKRTGRANRFGYYALATPIPLDQAGEYRVDIALRYSGPAGSWFGGRTWGGVVAPRSSPIVAHGFRGTMRQTSGRLPWFTRQQVIDSGTVPEGGQIDSFPLPFHSGDILWMADRDDTAAHATITFQDLEGSAVALLESRCSPCPPLLGPVPNDFGIRAQAGETPLFSRAPDYVDPHVDPSRVDLWAYAYRAIERPGVSVREFIGEDNVQSTNWYLLERYGFQPGNGTNGDRTNDFKFQFGGVVIRGAALEAPLFAPYASLFMLAPEDQQLADRTMPPFQGSGGGPSGGPLMTLKGREIDLFWHPTAVRPGTVLEIGNRVSFAGYFGPTLPCKLELTVTSPSGKVRHLAGQANQIGYFYDPDLDFYADEPGEWKVKVHGFFDGVTSAGQVTAPFPSGDVLGTADGVFSFYVVPRDAPALVVDKPEDSFVRPAEGAISIPIANPTGLSQTKVKFTTTMPGFLLEQGQLGGLSYTYDAPNLADDFPNLDLFDADGRAGVDTITMSLLTEGNDGTGAPQQRAKQLLLQGEELFNFPQEPAPPCANGEETLCLNSGRFLLRMRWSDGQGRTGVGHAVPLTADSGYFWFFRPDNVEVLVKALNACGFPGNPNFWIFAAGLTNVETTLEVTDTHTGEVRFYDNPLGKAFSPLQDTAAFPTCGAPASAPILAASSTLSPQLSPPGGGERAHIAAGAGTEAGAAAASTCAPSPTALCLAGGRFRVEATWKTAQGQSGSGQAVALTEDTGYFWFFRSDNVEVITKVLNACSFPGKPRFWTFAAGLTNVEVKLKVTDTQTGQVREYKNPLNRPFQPIQDTNAFATCP